MMNKKGLIEDWTDLIVTVFLGLFLFFFLNGILQEGVKSQEKNSLEQLNEMRAEELLLMYLRTPAEGGTMGEVVLLGEHQPEYRVILQQRTEELITATAHPLFRGVAITYSGDELQILLPDYLQELSAYATISIFNSQNQEIRVTIYGELKASEYGGRFAGGV